MNKLELYHKSHSSVKKDAGQLLRKFASKLQWRPDGGDSVLEIGCGPGDVSMDYVYPLMPENIEKLIFSDISSKMLNFFENNYEIPKKCHLRIINIAKENSLPPDMLGQFDHVISSLVLHWIPDNRTALENIFKLLRPEGGDCILTFFGYNNIFEANHIISSTPKWSPYIKNVNRFVSPLHNCSNPKETFCKMMEDLGFCNISIEVKEGIYYYDNFENFKENIIPVCGIFDFIPKSCHDEFLEDYFTVMAETTAKKRGLSLRDSMYAVASDMFVVYAQKRKQDQTTK
ncbi:juvenile hormone acid O-methyltransferase-like [Musca vetustissima]|uniref:juvenile hormone acid O-methyltransferase-like n=1 Tax=Musca vetustissima TaxID=27455 RepID=UPI002AB6A23F|nr:juvenile hormone acid O-methyltransferase-like [Musca vetustissima]